ncbi:HIRAN domain-containing protein [Massilia sp. GCM10023247]|uniref:HIRAN domain-containing protein n=1 Tax=Massilia sp. GCM10023247 TaxID=3252643 RepID=UPI00361D04B2
MNTLQHIYEPSRLLLVWRCAPSRGIRSRRLVALIEKDTHGGEVCLRYLTETEDYIRAIESGFEGYPAFDLYNPVHCKGVIDAFMRRLPPRKRDDFKDYLLRHRLPIDTPIPDLSLLAYTNAKLPSDGFEVYPDLSDACPPFDLIIEVAGFRHQKDIDVNDIYLGDPVDFKAEHENSHDPNAVGIYYSGVRIGFVDRAQAPSFRKWMRQGFSVKGTIERINGTRAQPAVYVFVAIR